MHYNGLFIQRGASYTNTWWFISFCPVNFYCSRTSNKFCYSTGINQAWHATGLNSPGFGMCIYVFRPCIINQTSKTMHKTPSAIITHFSVLTAASLLVSCHPSAINLAPRVSPHFAFFLCSPANGLELLYVHEANELRREIYWQP